VSFSKNFFTVGVFADARESLENFNFNIYFSYMIQDSINKRNNLQKLYDKALLDRDAELMQETKKELDLFDNSFALTTAILNQNDQNN
jgi:hypothetical protein